MIKQLLLLSYLLISIIGFSQNNTFPLPDSTKNKTALSQGYEAITLSNKKIVYYKLLENNTEIEYSTLISATITPLGIWNGSAGLVRENFGINLNVSNTSILKDKNTDLNLSIFLPIKSIGAGNQLGNFGISNGINFYTKLNACYNFSDKDIIKKVKLELDKEYLYDRVDYQTGRSKSVYLKFKEKMPIRFNRKFGVNFGIQYFIHPRNQIIDGSIYGNSNPNSFVILNNVNKFIGSIGIKKELYTSIKTSVIEGSNISTSRKRELKLDFLYNIFSTASHIQIIENYSQYSINKEYSYNDNRILDWGWMFGYKSFRHLAGRTYFNTGFDIGVLPKTFSIDKFGDCFYLSFGLGISFGI